MFVKSESEGSSSSEVERRDSFMAYGEVGVGSVTMSDILHKEMVMWLWIWRGR